ncbi:unnamed protein product [Brachionus calyciflorus]|uniref:Uncharacterized protein n=1 Tax=Brachionus calyciflorus TaxID=104777 RepID=A0A813NLA0_9BILA|nr:unnamed protein product [Brachionus calyciflorus]
MGNCASLDQNKLIKIVLNDKDDNKLNEAHLQNKILSFNHHENIVQPFYYPTNQNQSSCICQLNQIYNRNELISKLFEEHEKLLARQCKQNCQTNIKTPVSLQALTFQDNYFCKTLDTQMNNFVCNQDNEFLLLNNSINFLEYKTLKFNRTKKLNGNLEINQLAKCIDNCSHHVNRKNKYNASKKIDYCQNSQMNRNDDKISENIFEKNSLCHEIKIEKFPLKMDESDKLKLQSIIEAVGFILFPSALHVNQALKDLLIDYKAYDSFK